MAKQKNDDNGPGASRFDSERNLILKDEDGHYYCIPVRQLPQNIIRKAFVPNLEKILREQTPEKSIEVVGIFELTRTLRRKWAPPIVQPIGELAPHPTS